MFILVMECLSSHVTVVVLTKYKQKILGRIETTVFFMLF
jgi:hypothetical protein